MVDGQTTESGNQEVSDETAAANDDSTSPFIDDNDDDDEVRLVSYAAARSDYRAS